MGNNQTETDGRWDATRALVIVPVLKSVSPASGGGEQISRLSRPGETRLAEAVGLAEAIELDVVHADIVALNTVRPATLIGSGKVDEIAGLVVSLDAGLVIVDHPLTPVQQRNLEKAWKAKVIDRTGLILEIFGRRASTKEGVLQVQLAHLNYQKGRLVRSWTHLERQRGGAGFMGGPGETQIEADRRILQEKIVRLERELEQVRRTRQLHRAKRKKVPHPVVALVGYTNAGKSTLFNTITGAGVLAEDMLFATLDPTLRRMTLPHGRMVILSDTVGFISDLPTHLVAAFRATLEEVLEADLVLHVRDMSDPDNQAHCADVLRILSELGVNRPGSSPTEIIEVWNKIDLLPQTAVDDMIGKSASSDRVAAVSAVTGKGIDGLLALIEETLSGTLLSETVVLRPRELSHMAWLYDHANVLDRDDKEDGSVALDLEITQHEMAEFERRRRVAS
ncbi:GTPase HflX [Nitratireductor sp. XY-223]|uniref:GTPase HflX n=1 Tax=Nitratireductor sp. XY-223 TaxID=2561926 RepID=UPI0010A9E1B3|nr:GTPase HflX [Nitratireductor sp. XY-223]